MPSFAEAVLARHRGSVELSEPAGSKASLALLVPLRG